MRDSKASVVIPADQYSLDWLEDSIQSALAQNYSNYEVIVANRTQDKEFADIIRNMASSVKHVTIHGTAEYPTWISSLEALSGEVIFFLSPGDRFHPHKIQAHMTLRKERPEVILSYNAKFLVDSKNNMCYQETIPPTRNITDFINHLPMRLSDIVLKKNQIFQINESDLRFGSAVGDAAFILQNIFNGSIVAGINKPLNYQKQWIDYYATNPDSDEFADLLEALDDFFYDPRQPQVRTSMLSYPHLH